MSFKKSFIPFCLILFSTFLMHDKAFAIVETKQPSFVSLKQEKRPQTEDKIVDKWATASLVIGISTYTIALLLMIITSNAIFFMLGAITALLSLICGIKALQRIKKESNKRKGKSIAIVGIVFSGLYLILAALLILSFLIIGYS